MTSFFLLCTPLSWKAAVPAGLEAGNRGKLLKSLLGLLDTWESWLDPDPVAPKLRHGTWGEGIAWFCPR